MLSASMHMRAIVNQFFLQSSFVWRSMLKYVSVTFEPVCRTCQPGTADIVKYHDIFCNIRVWLWRVNIAQLTSHLTGLIACQLEAKAGGANFIGMATANELNLFGVEFYGWFIIHVCVINKEGLFVFNPSNRNFAGCHRLHDEQKLVPIQTNNK
jgi:hypothetical protein